jgi:hypothetical protein
MEEEAAEVVRQTRKPRKSAHRWTDDEEELLVSKWDLYQGNVTNLLHDVFDKRFDAMQIRTKAYMLRNTGKWDRIKKRLAKMSGQVQVVEKIIEVKHLCKDCQHEQVCKHHSHIKQLNITVAVTCCGNYYGEDM